MRKMFPGYYKPTKKEFAELWKNGLIILDANILLNLFRYSSSTREKIFSILEKYKKRIWIPNQVALEFLKNRPTVISQQFDAYDKIDKCLNDINKTFSAEINSHKKHPIINADLLAKEFNNGIEAIKAKLQASKELHKDNGDDDIFDKITMLLDGKVGNRYSDEQISMKHKEAEARFKKEIPPGYLDNEKSNGNKFGDYVLWSQILDKLKNDKIKFAIFVTDDKKDDWWLTHKGKTSGPRPELINEAFSSANCFLYIYNTETFLENDNLSPDDKISDEQKKEISNLPTLDPMSWRVSQETFQRLLSDTKLVSDNLNVSTEKKLKELFLRNKIASLRAIVALANLKNNNKGFKLPATSDKWDNVNNDIKLSNMENEISILEHELALLEDD